MAFDVLVVDDDFRVARIHAHFVESTPGFAVCGTARDGAEAIELASHLTPDLVLLDIHLPDRSGIDVLTDLHEVDPPPGVIMVTADRDADVVRAALHRGAVRYLVKPFEQADLSARLIEVADLLGALGSGDVDQATIDRAFGTSTDTGPAMPKGLSSETAELVAATLAESGELSAAECSASVGISRVTARRYLEYFVAHGRALVRLNYGTTGRPERRYFSASSDGAPR